MDDVPLPKVDYDAGWHRQYTADQMHAHAAAVSAAKDAEIAQLRADLIKSLADNKALRERVRVLEDALREYANPLNWNEDSAGIRRVWLEPRSTTPAAYNGFEAARAALEQKP